MTYILILHGLQFRIARAARGNIWGMKGWCVNVGSNVYDGFKTRKAAVAYAHSFYEETL
jgi:hypothetical protein